MYLLIYLCGFKKVTFVFVSLTAVVIVAEQIFSPLKDEFPPLWNIKMRFTTFLRHLIAKVSHQSFVPKQPWHDAPADTWPGLSSLRV